MKKATVADALSGAKPKTLRGPVVLVIIIAIGIALWATGTINQWLNYPPENRIGAAVQLTISGPLAWRMNGDPMPDPMDVGPGQTGVVSKNYPGCLVRLDNWDQTSRRIAEVEVPCGRLKLRP
jgi:hypothetical protein